MRNPAIEHEVHDQYEALPYPPRQPADERRRLLGTVLDSLPLINHYGFGGRRDFGDGFRVLVAGGGTGDAAVFLAEQLRGTAARVVYLDVSHRSLEIARERARVRGLDNIEWIRGSLLDLPAMDLGRFDYINCCGVLHHLPSADAGLEALGAVLAEDGVIGVMVYSRHARAPVYQLQELLRHVNTGVTERADKIAHARHIVDSLPPTNLFKAQMLRHKAELESGDAALYDLLLHARDQPFSVPELYDWLERCGLELIEFVSPIGQKRYYRPETFVTDPDLRRHLSALPPRSRHAIGDMIGLAAANHAFYCARRVASPPSPADGDMVPFFFPALEASAHTGAALAKRLEGSRRYGDSLELPLQFGTLSVPNGPLFQDLVGRIDGRRSVAEITEQAAAAGAIDVAAAREAFAQLYDCLHAIDMVLLRHTDVAPFVSADQLHATGRG